MFTKGGKSHFQLSTYQVYGQENKNLSLYDLCPILLNVHLIFTIPYWASISNRITDMITISRFKDLGMIKDSISNGSNV